MENRKAADSRSSASDRNLDCGLAPTGGAPRRHVVKVITHQGPTSGGILKLRLLVASTALLAAALMALILTPKSAQAQTLTTLHTFDSTDGSRPFGTLVQGTDGNLYGTTSAGGPNGAGTVFKITPSGMFTMLYSFCNAGGFCADGEFPEEGFVQASNGNFYGTTYQGGTHGSGTIFKITASGTLTTVYNFCPLGGFCTDGNAPHGGLIQAPDGNLYGTTYSGGQTNFGTVFRITPSGTLTTLHSFCAASPCADGSDPYGGLVLASNGYFYGITAHGGNLEGAGTVFRITATGTLTTLYNFCSQSACADGNEPLPALVQASNGDFYGTTYEGGANNYGTVFKITPSGTITTLHSFDLTDGANPYSGLVQATDGNLYGTTNTSTEDYGTVFKITPSGTLTTVYTFCSLSDCTDGSNPYGGLIQDTNGILYGTTSAGGTIRLGTVFSLSMGLHPFVETQPASGKVGAAVKILGTNLTGATSVTFNGTASAFTVVSSSEITTTVPTGATTGKVNVTTPSRTLSSNLNFRVTP